ncbi:MAG: O-acetyl-ADP-ribose deacetylase [Elusimicrobia bacterium]|nr:O-acetyl-ADP-ribose deacetylase [Elusimicrobiota bacterium]
MPSSLSAGAARIRLMTGDITEVPADAVVNAANSRLAGGGGVDGAIHRAGGPSIMAELDRVRPPGGCPAGQAVATGAGALPAKWVIHAVGPIWRGGGRQEAEALASAYRSSLRLAAERGAKIVTFPSISTGVYGYPVEKAAAVALSAVAGFLAAGAGSIEEAVFVLFDPGTYSAYAAALDALAERGAQR